MSARGVEVRLYNIHSTYMSARVLLEFSGLKHTGLIKTLLAHAIRLLVHGQFQVLLGIPLCLPPEASYSVVPN